MEKFPEPEEQENSGETAVLEKEEGYEADMLRLYFGIKEKAGDSPETEEFLLQVEEASLRYEHSIARIEKGGLEGWERDDIAAADERRRTIHNALMADIDILARIFESKGLDTSWKRMIGLTRDEIGNWALIVAKHLRKLVKETYEKRQAS